MSKTISTDTPAQKLENDTLNWRTFYSRAHQRSIVEWDYRNAEGRLHSGTDYTLARAKDRAKNKGYREGQYHCWGPNCDNRFDHRDFTGSVVGEYCSENCQIRDEDRKADRVEH